MKEIQREDTHENTKKALYKKREDHPTYEKQRIFPNIVLPHRPPSLATPTFRNQRRGDCCLWRFSKLQAKAIGKTSRSERKIFFQNLLANFQVAYFFGHHTLNMKGKLGPKQATMNQPAKPGPREPKRLPPPQFQDLLLRLARLASNVASKARGTSLV